MLIILELSGIDCTIFRAHSFRAAASSKLHSKGFSVKELVNCGLWKDGNTFKNIYLRNIKMNSDKKVSSARMTNLLLSK
jgi:hypothetical protein